MMTDMDSNRDRSKKKCYDMQTLNVDRVLWTQDNATNSDSVNQQPTSQSINQSITVE